MFSDARLSSGTVRYILSHPAFVIEVLRTSSQVQSAVSVRLPPSITHFLIKHRNSPLSCRALTGFLTGMLIGWTGIAQRRLFSVVYFVAFSFPLLVCELTVCR